MARYAYKCMKCRARNMFNHPLEWYKRNKVCRECGHWRFYWDKERNLRTFKGVEPRGVCSCSAYHHPHRPQAKFCEKNPASEYNTRVFRYGENPLDVAADIGFDGAVSLSDTDPCPF